MQLFWHRRDLRTADNRGLAAAAADGPVAALFVLDPVVLAHAGAPRVAFLLDALDALRESYRDRGSDLLVLQNRPERALPRVADALDADRVVWNRDYTGLARTRDERVRAALDDAGVAHDDYADAVLHEPGTILTSAGEPYSVYSYYWRKWRDRPKDEPVDAPADAALAAVSAEQVGDASDGTVAGATDAVPTFDDLAVDSPGADLPDAGPTAARDRLTAFCEADVYRYDEAGDYPAEAATSRLSQDLTFGSIGVREVWAETEAAMVEAADDAGRESVESFQSQLAWREFYAQVLAADPSLVRENGTAFERDIPWREDSAGLVAWKDGRTGYPLVDAGMRQLRAEAYVHNRVRMVVASFLTKDLLVDWRVGYDWFRERLVDHDTANDVGGWQWAASTGTDAQPYFRVFNPTTQCARFDPDGAYVREYVPELRDVPTEHIHGWPTLDDAERERLAPGYPAPIVDHGTGRARAIEAFEWARGG